MLNSKDEKNFLLWTKFRTINQQIRISWQKVYELMHESRKSEKAGVTKEEDDAEKKWLKLCYLLYQIIRCWLWVSQLV